MGVFATRSTFRPNPIGMSLVELKAIRTMRDSVILELGSLDLVDGNRHVTAWQNGRLIACARLLAPHDGQDAVTIGRVVVAPDARGQQLGHQLLMHSQAACARHWPGRAQYLSAQAHLQHFYQQFGFAVCGDGYDEDGIPHVPMRTAG